MSLQHPEVPVCAPAIEAISSEQLDQRKLIVFDTLRTGVRVYLFGLHSDIEKLREEGSGAIRVGGQLLANSLDVTPVEAANHVTDLYETDVVLQSSAPHMVSFIAARLAEGLYEAGNQEAAQHLASTLVDSDHRPGVEKYFELKDGTLVRPHHV